MILGQVEVWWSSLRAALSIPRITSAKKGLEESAEMTPMVRERFDRIEPAMAFGM